MDLYDIFIIVVVALCSLPGLIGKKKHGNADVPRRVFSEIEIDDPELIDDEYDEDDETDEEIDNPEIVPVPVEPHMTERNPEQVLDPVSEPVFAAVSEPLPASIPPESVYARMSADIADPAEVVPRMDIAGQIETEKRKKGLHIDPENMIVYSALMNPKFKEF